MAEERADKSLMARARRWLNRNMPTRESLAQNRLLKPVAHRFLRPELWHFTRRSVPSGVAIGIFAGFALPVGQIPLAAFLCLPFRANVALAVLFTFLTNPFTFPFWIWLGNKIGAFLLRIDSITHGEVLQTHLDSWLADWLYWLMKEAGVTAVGLLFLAFVGAAVSYLLAARYWSWWVGRKWKRRLHARKLS